MFGLYECGTLRYDYDKKTRLTVLSTQLWIFLGGNVIGGCYMRGLTWVQCNMYELLFLAPLSEANSYDMI